MMTERRDLAFVAVLAEKTAEERAAFLIRWTRAMYDMKHMGKKRPSWSVKKPRKKKS